MVDCLFDQRYCNVLWRLAQVWLGIANNGLSNPLLPSRLDFGCLVGINILNVLELFTSFKQTMHVRTYPSLNSYDVYCLLFFKITFARIFLHKPTNQKSNFASFTVENQDKITREQTVQVEHVILRLGVLVFCLRGSGTVESQIYRRLN